ncbi:MAG: 50S ribosomal protein L29 [Thaumarchaeota archaeon]|nr:50S ribosomal protein L29 [Nitrososphaerota archaeon]
MKAKTLREQDQEQLRDRLFELRGELSKLRNLAARGMIQKQAGNINKVQKDVARVLTVMREKGISE